MKGIGFYGEEFFKQKKDKELLRENITRILLTEPYERPFSAFGCNLKKFLFSSSFVLKEDIENDIISSIMTWEPRVDIKRVNVEMIDNKKIEVKLFLIIKSTLEPMTYEEVIKF
jgi:phage baseplate assembly protein W